MLKFVVHSIALLRPGTCLLVVREITRIGQYKKINFRIKSERSKRSIENSILFHDCKKEVLTATDNNSTNLTEQLPLTSND